MKKSVVKFLCTLAIFVVIGLMQKTLFMLRYHSLLEGTGFADILAVFRHGMAMDLSVAGYLTMIPAILTIAGIWTTRRWVTIAEKSYFAIISVVISLVTFLDLELYGYWGFRIDMTPIFYFTTSPEAALASASLHEIIIGLLGMGVVAWGLYRIFVITVLRIHPYSHSRRLRSSVIMLLLTALLIIPIRGGVTVSTMNLSRSYFSDNQRLNHAAVNPLFSLLYSATHQNKFMKEYRFMDSGEARAALAALNAECIAADSPADTCSTHNNPLSEPLLKCTRPDIYMVILESFSAHLMPSLGGESIALNLDSLAREGLSFTNFYANSFRTDRALPSILSGFPAQPSMSLLKYVDKIEKLPSLAGELKTNGYETTYYYGGDIDFANIKAYLISSGFNRIISDQDFPLTQRTGKWGAPDHLVFRKAIDEIPSDAGDEAPRFRVIQTSSSHEPFDVPYHNPRFDDSPQKNAFAYTDSCLMDFIDHLRTSPRWDCTLVVMVPDHLGAWPLNLEPPSERHHVPLVMVGGALNHAGLQADMPASQIDIAATLLRQLGIDASRFPFSKDMLNPEGPHYAVFTEPSMIGLITPADTMVYNCDALQPVGTVPSAERQTQARAYLQTIYETISEL